MQRQTPELRNELDLQEVHWLLFWPEQVAQELWHVIDTQLKFPSITNPLLHWQTPAITEAFGLQVWQEVELPRQVRQFPLHEMHWLREVR